MLEFDGTTGSKFSAFLRIQTLQFCQSFHHFLFGLLNTHNQTVLLLSKGFNGSIDFTFLLERRHYSTLMISLRLGEPRFLKESHFCLNFLFSSFDFFCFEVVLLFFEQSDVVNELLILFSSLSLFLCALGLLFIQDRSGHLSLFHHLLSHLICFCVQHLTLLCYAMPRSLSATFCQIYRPRKHPQYGPCFTVVV